jgi:hypothetical protein
MAKYRVIDTSFINNLMTASGSVVEYDPPTGTTIGANLQLVPDSTPLAWRPPMASELGNAGQLVE